MNRMRWKLLFLCFLIRYDCPSSANDDLKNDGAVIDSEGEQNTASQTVLIRPVADFNDLQDPNRDDPIEDSMLDPLASDPSCLDDDETDCWEPPKTTIETEQVKIDATCSYGGDDPSEQVCTTTEVEVDKHWGSDARILRIRDQLRNAGSGSSDIKSNKRPPIFLLPGLASTRLVAWRHKACSHTLLSDIKIQDYVWLNINLVIQMGTIDVACMTECMKLGLNQSDTDDLETGCKVRITNRA